LAPSVQGEDKSFVFTGWVDCGRRSESRCRVEDALTLWTDDFGSRQQVSIDVSWISASLPPLDQDDFICVEVSSSGGVYQATSVVSCKNDDKPKKSREKNDPVATSTPRPASQQTLREESAPASRVVVNIAVAQNSSPAVEGTPVVFAITLSSAINEVVSVDLTYQDITATGGLACPIQQGQSNVDYITDTRTLTFPPLTTLILDTRPTCFEFPVESNETFRGVISNPSANATIGTGSATAEIEDDSN
ncbi:MAG: hypothetical protein ACKVVP_25065, partial [Chloroflexota bacterium]